MSNIVPSGEIEKIVGFPRRIYMHVGRAVSKEETFYILHSYTCTDRNLDLRECIFSKALNNGVTFDKADTPLNLSIKDDFLVGVDMVRTNRPERRTGEG